jgi:hypothetical protein
MDENGLLFSDLYKKENCKETSKNSIYKWLRSKSLFLLKKAGKKKFVFVWKDSQICTKEKGFFESTEVIKHYE